MSRSYEKIRNHAGLVDLENWVRFEVAGPDASDALDSVVGGNVQDLFEGKAMNTLIPTLDGGVEAILWIIAIGDGFLVIAEPEESQPIENILNCLERTFDIAVTRQAETLFHMVLTGPEAEALAEEGLGDEIASMSFLSACKLQHGVTAARIGFFGEYELHLVGPADEKQKIVNALTAAGGEDIIVDQMAFPAMMAEMRVLNRVRDIKPGASVFDAGLQWMIDFKKDSLRGADALNARRDEGGRICVLALLDGETSAGELNVDGQNIGDICSCYISHTLNKTIALVYMDADLAVPGLVLDSASGLIRTVSAPAFLSKSVTNVLERSI